MNDVCLLACLELNVGFRYERKKRLARSLAHSSCAALSRTCLFKTERRRLSLEEAVTTVVPAVTISSSSSSSSSSNSSSSSGTCGIDIGSDSNRNSGSNNSDYRDEPQR